MTTSPMKCAVEHLRKVVLSRDGGDLTDSQLLTHFIERRDEAAFEAIVRRHGPMVFGVCRRVLQNPHDTEDAFQATMLVLVRKATSIFPREMVGNWLYGVAYNTALRARVATAKRRARERQVREMPEPEPIQPTRRHDLISLIDVAMSRLPDKYRIPIVLCDLEGETRKEAARQLGWPEGTLSGRLARARAMLAKRLIRAGLVLSEGSLAVMLFETAVSAPVPASLVASTLKTASPLVAGKTAAGLASANVVGLMEGVLKSMLLTKLKVTLGVLVALSAFAITTGTLLVPTADAVLAEGDKERPPQPLASAKELHVQVRIASPPGMKIGVLLPKGQGDRPPQIEVPGRLDLEQGKRFSLKLTKIPNYPGMERYPTIEIPHSDAATELFVTTSAIPIDFTDSDFDHVNSGKVITKVIYLPSRKKEQKLAARPGEAITITSYDLPGRDAIEEANRQGTILAILRMGNIDLENRDQDLGRVTPSGKNGKVVEITIGNDGIQGRAVPLNQDFIAAKDKAMRELEVTILVLKQQIKKAELENKSLQELLMRKEQELQKIKKLKKDDGK